MNRFDASTFAAPSELGPPTKPERKGVRVDFRAMRARVLAALALMFTVCSELPAATLTVNGFKYSDPLFETRIEVNLAGVVGVTGVEAVSAGGVAQALSPSFIDQYDAVFGPYPDFVSFLGAIAGNWKLAIHFGASGSAVYYFAVSGFGSPAGDPFPPAPTLISPTDGAIGVSLTPSFKWNTGGTHSGVLESLFVNVSSLVNPTIGEFTNSFGGIALNSDMWTPSVVLPGGAASFLVQYETNENEDARVAIPVFNGPSSTRGDPHISWDDHSGDLFSRDLITFFVVPLEIAAIVRHNDNIELEVVAPLDLLVGIEYSPTLIQETWIPLGEVVMSAGSGTFIDDDPVRARLPQGFYRAVGRTNLTPMEFFGGDNRRIPPK